MPRKQGRSGYELGPCRGGAGCGSPAVRSVKSSKCVYAILLPTERTRARVLASSYLEAFTMALMQRKCQGCGTEFFPIAPAQLYCNRCRRKKDWRGQTYTVTRICPHCGKEFIPTRKDQVFCRPHHRSAHYNATHDIAGRLRRMRSERRDT